MFFFYFTNEFNKSIDNIIMDKTTDTSSIGQNVSVGICFRIVDDNYLAVSELFLSIGTGLIIF